MSELQIRVHVSARAAIAAGKTKVGAQTLTVTETDLVRLSAAERAELALVYEAGETVGLKAGEPEIAEPSFDALCPVLTIRAQRRVALDEVAKKAAADQAERDAVAARNATEKNSVRSRALRAWIEKKGDDEQKARMAEGYLSEAEILEDVCDELCDLPGFSRYDPLLRVNACDCACMVDVKFDERAPKHLDAHQWSKLREAREAAPAGTTVTPVEHFAACPSCQCVPIARLEVRVTMEWHGFELVRQYALT